MKEFIGNERCMITYGDGLSDINIKDLIHFHEHHKKMVTTFAIASGSPFEADENGCELRVSEKPQLVMAGLMVAFGCRT